MMLRLLSKLLNVDLTTPSEPVDTNVSEDEVWELLHPTNKHELLNSELWELLQSEKYDEVILRAGKLLGDRQEAISNNAYQLIGLSLFRQAKFQEALPYLQKVTEYNPTVKDWFNIATAGTLSRNIEIGRIAFGKAVQQQLDTGHEEQPSIPFMRQHYACALRDVGEFHLALEQINELRKLYEQLIISDTTFLYLRGVPFLSHTMDIAVDVFNGLGPSFKAKEWIESFSLRIDAEGQEYLNEVKAKICS